MWKNLSMVHVRREGPLQLALFAWTYEPYRFSEIIVFFSQQISISIGRFSNQPNRKQTRWTITRAKTMKDNISVRKNGMASTDGCSSTEIKVYLIVQRTQVEIQETSDFGFSAEDYYDRTLKQNTKLDSTQVCQTLVSTKISKLHIISTWGEFLCRSMNCDYNPPELQAKRSHLHNT